MTKLTTVDTCVFSLFMVDFLSWMSVYSATEGLYGGVLGLIGRLEDLELGVYTTIFIRSSNTYSKMSGRWDSICEFIFSNRILSIFFMVVIFGDNFTATWNSSTTSFSK